MKTAYLKTLLALAFKWGWNQFKEQVVHHMLSITWCPSCLYILCVCFLLLYYFFKTYICDVWSPLLRHDQWEKRLRLNCELTARQKAKTQPHPQCRTQEEQQSFWGSQGLVAGWCCEWDESINIIFTFWFIEYSIKQEFKNKLFCVFICSIYVNITINSNMGCQW